VELGSTATWGPCAASVGLACAAVQLRPVATPAVAAVSAAIMVSVFRRVRIRAPRLEMNGRSVVRLDATAAVTRVLIRKAALLLKIVVMVRSAFFAAVSVGLLHHSQPASEIYLSACVSDRRFAEAPTNVAPKAR